MADDGHVKSKDLKDLKVVELRKELHERGLSITGNKSDLISRLEEHLLKHDEGEEIEVEEGVFDSEIENITTDLEHDDLTEDTFDEQDSGNDSKNEQTDEKSDVPSENIPPDDDLSNVEDSLELIKSDEQPRKTPLTSLKTESERKLDRQKRFAIPLNEKQKKLARAERFAISGSKTEGIVRESSQLEKLSKRAERFGAVSKAVAKTVEEEKMKKRKERFGALTSALPSDVETRKKMRSERFKS
ncbi:SAP domain-containing ribonucleoprotein-like isoform X2 [Xenia sp. Carnegie-2017]|uniref:SAP domain-containing ribonucleoprotein-like isoform X2 n=1 Tax=Xenia sp. Carnegie-2017 TaxID=2897299 RepID=UPI001F04D9A8|nr:SAP domain-containing ribonucleoprotein-like isoform X2 [Xenia sp. Carnegie-2017]